MIHLTMTSNTNSNVYFVDPGMARTQLFAVVFLCDVAHSKGNLLDFRAHSGPTEKTPVTCVCLVACPKSHSRVNTAKILEYAHTQL